ncbi:protein YgfX [Celerinatantimonas yamalensis]|uniref:Protein YgfX n=1 Tax=Celerinatantimonas yamalensis TaxID=559956 RepID=A0ABW9G7T2_9GAMM
MLSLVTTSSHIRVKSSRIARCVLIVGTVGLMVGIYIERCPWIDLWLIGWAAYLLWQQIAHVPTSVILQGPWLNIEQRWYRLEPGSQVGTGFCWLKLSYNGERRCFLMIHDMLEQTSYRHLCLVLRCL